MPDECNSYDRDALIESLKNETLPGHDKTRYEELLDYAGGDDEKLAEGLRAHATGSALAEHLRSLPDPPVEPGPVWVISNELAEMCGMSRKDFLKLARKWDLPAYTWRTGEGLVKVSLSELRPLYSDRTIVCFDMHDVIQFEREHPDWLRKKTNAQAEKEATENAIIKRATKICTEYPQLGLEILGERVRGALETDYPRVKGMADSTIMNIIRKGVFPERQGTKGGRPRKAKGSHQ